MERVKAALKKGARANSSDELSEENLHYKTVVGPNATDCIIDDVDDGEHHDNISSEELMKHKCGNTTIGNGCSETGSLLKRRKQNKNVDGDPGGTNRLYRGGDSGDVCVIKKYVVYIQMFQKTSG